MTESIKISVIIPVYNTRPYLKEALDSVCDALEGIEAEIICVENGSDDGSIEILDSYGESKPMISVYHTEKLGAGAARNYGLEKAKGEYIAFVDSDDKVAVNIYRDMLYLCEENELDLCVCNVTRFEGRNKGTVSGQYQRAFEGDPKLITTIEESMSFIYDGGPWNKLIRRDFWEKHAFCYSEVSHYEDMPVFLKLFCTVDRFAVMHSFGYYWRITPGGSSISQQVSSLQTLKDRIEVCAEILEYLKGKYGHDSPLARSMEGRLLLWEFDSNLWHFEKLDEETRHAFFENLCTFLRDNISEESLQGIPVFHRKRYEYIMNGDIESLVRLMNHRRMGWRTAPIIEKDGHHYLKLPEDIYGQDLADASIELQDDIPVTRMSVFSQDGFSVKGNVVVYQPRVSAPDPESQEINAFLYNEHTGQRIDIDCAPLKVEPWTEVYGRTICHDDYRVYDYNYDWAGVTITMDFEKVLERDEASRKILEEAPGIRPRWMIFVEYKTPVLEGVRPLRGFLPKARRSTPGLDVVLEKDGRRYRYDFVQGIRDSLYIEVNKL